jgi:hypothetical protein
MLFFVALFVVPALAAFSFQLVCYMNYKNTTLRSNSLKWGHRAGLQNV